MSWSDAGHRYLKIGRFHRNDRNAEEYLLALLRPHYAVRTDKELTATIFEIDYGKGPFKRSFREMHAEAKETGSVRWLRTYLNGQDMLFPGAIEFAVGEGLKVSATYAGQTIEFDGPMRVHGIEDELCDDILQFRRAACEGAVDDFKACARSYRAYIFASTALIEAFLNRPTFLPGKNARTRAAILELQTPMNIENRIALWVQTFCAKPLATLLGSASWSQYQELRKERNRLLHAFDSQAFIALRVLPTRLNWVRVGVGGLMRILREMQGLPPLDFIDRLETAPLVEYKSSNPPIARQRTSRDHAEQP